jgi:glycosyltransferase involved in cell wall biosynthesis
VNESTAVIIPTYNRAATLPRALDSVYKQTMQAAEVCVVDDGSTDCTEQLIKSRYPNVRYIRRENGGVSAARNSGIVATTSRWLAFLDSDDEWLPKKLELQLAALQNNSDQRLIHCNEHWIRNGKLVNKLEKHRKRGGHIFPHCLPLCVISPSTVMIDRSLLSEMEGFDESLPACEDYDLWLRICCREAVLYLDTPLLNKYAGHEDQPSTTYWGMDRFRVQALSKLLRSSCLTREQASLAGSTLIDKTQILRNGALKRRKHKDLRYYDTLLAEFSHFQVAS